MGYCTVQYVRLCTVHDIVNSPLKLLSQRLLVRLLSVSYELASVNSSLPPIVCPPDRAAAAAAAGGEVGRGVFCIV